jgi:alkylated DNA repair dioxygenase AlkB
MEQLSFFSDAGQSPGIPDDLIYYQPGLIDPDTSSRIMQDLITQAPWQQRIVKMYDKEVVTPRLTAWYGDPHTYDYTVLGNAEPTPWTPALLKIKDLVETVAGVKFNSVLLNYYRDGNDSVAWHSDKERALGTHPTIASVSFGQVRSFDIRKKSNHAERYSIRLEDGSLMIMKGNLQTEWEHRIAKSNKPIKARLNLTFRVVIQP